MSGYATITVNASSWARVTRERDEARDDCERLNRLLRHETALGQGEIDHWAALERERDEAREALEHMKRERQNFHEAWKKFCNPFLEATK